MNREASRECSCGDNFSSPFELGSVSENQSAPAESNLLTKVRGRPEKARDRELIRIRPIRSFR